MENVLELDNGHGYEQCYECIKYHWTIHFETVFILCLLSLNFKII